MSNIPELHAKLKAQIQNGGDYQHELVEQSFGELNTRIGQLQFLAGDIVLWSEYNDTAMEWLAKETGNDINTIKSYARVSKAWDESTRYDILKANPLTKYSHMLALVPIINDPKYGMNKALEAIEALSKDNFTVKWLRRYIAVTIRKNKPKPKQVKKFEGIAPIWINDSNDWEIIIPHDDMDIRPSDGKTYKIQIHEIEDNESQD